MKSLEFTMSLPTVPEYSRPAELILKRAVDIAGGLAGVILTILIGIVIAPMIYLESPGPVIFKQTRIGKRTPFLPSINPFHVYGCGGAKERADGEE